VSLYIFVKKWISLILSTKCKKFDVILIVPKQSTCCFFIISWLLSEYFFAVYVEEVLPSC
jgi:hypothetical protein